MVTDSLSLFLLSARVHDINGNFSGVGRGGGSDLGHLSPKKVSCHRVTLPNLNIPHTGVISADFGHGNIFLLMWDL